MRRNPSMAYLQRKKTEAEVALLGQQLKAGSGFPWRDAITRYWGPAVIAGLALFVATTAQQLGYWSEQKRLEAQVACTNKRIDVFSSVGTHIPRYLSAQTNKAVAQCETTVIGMILESKSRNVQVDRKKALACLQDVTATPKQADAALAALIATSDSELRLAKSTYHQQTIEHRKVRQENSPLVRKDLRDAKLFFGPGTAQHATNLEKEFESMRLKDLDSAHLDRVLSLYQALSLSMQSDLQNSFEIPAPGCPVPPKWHWWKFW